MKKKEGLFFCGTSNIELPVSNKSLFPTEYQDKSRLNYYASLFNSLEVNSSFYRIPMARTVEKWANDVPEGFRFTFKLWKGISHARELIYDAADVGRFMQTIDRAGEKKGCVLLQLPASIKISQYRKVKQLIEHIQSANPDNGWKLAVEFRDKSWYNEKVYEMLEQYAGSMVVHDMPASATPMIDMEADFMYLRFHGEEGNYRGGYSEDFLQEHCGLIKKQIAEGKPVFAYFNNTLGSAVENALLLSDMCRVKVAHRQQR